MSSSTLDPKDPDVAEEYAIDWHLQLVPLLQRDTEYDLNDVVRPLIGTGWYYRCTAAGRTAAVRPAVLPRVATETFKDGSATFEALHPDSASVPKVQSASWTVPSGITKDSQREVDFTSYITLSGGTDGEDYDITCRMTPTSGNPAEQTITVPVRSQ